MESKIRTGRVLVRERVREQVSESGKRESESEE